MTSYADEHSEYVYNWPNIIHNIRHGFFGARTAKEWEAAAASWVTCACGNQCAVLPRSGVDYEDGEPDDEELRLLGCRFSWQISDALDAGTVEERNIYCDRALATLESIEVRSAELLAAMKK